MLFHMGKQSEVISELKTDVKRGLSAEEVGSRLEKYGENRTLRTDWLL